MKLTDVIDKRVNQNEIPEVYEAAMYQYAVYLNRPLTLEEIKCFEVTDYDDIDVIKLVIINRIHQIIYKYLIEYDEDYHAYFARIVDDDNQKTRQYGIGGTPAAAMLSFQDSQDGYLDMLLELNLEMTFDEMVECINNDKVEWEKRRRKFQDEQVIHRCSFCGKREQDVDILVEANEDTYICNECIDELEDFMKRS